MEEIWTLQPRFARRTRKRTFRLLEHPRFRAAYDFLLLRAAESGDLREQGEWWTRAQALPAEQLAAELGGKPAGQTEPAKSASAPGKSRNKRRGGRRRRRKSPAADK